MKNSILKCVCVVVALSSCKNSDSKSNISRTTVTKAIYYLKKTIATNDSKQIAEFIPQDILKDASIDNYELAVADFGKIFASLDVNQLMLRDTISKDFFIKGDPCMITYSIYVNKSDTVTFAFLQDKEPSYASTHEETEDGDDLSVYCEHHFYWKFRIVDGKMKLISILIAG